MKAARHAVSTFPVFAAVVLLALAGAMMTGCPPIYRLDDGTTVRELRDDQLQSPLARARLELAELAAQKTRATGAAIAARKIQRATLPSPGATTAWKEAQRQGQSVTDSYNRAAKHLERGDLAAYRSEVDLFSLMVAGLEDYAVNASALEPTPMGRPTFDPRDIPAPPLLEEDTP